jgi:hypothetical protein
MEEEPVGTPLSVLEYPVMRPVDMSSPATPQAGFTTAPVSPFADPIEAATPTSAQEPDWSNFARDLASNPLFSGPPSRHSQQTLPPSTTSPSMMLPPLEFQRRPSSGLQSGLLADRRDSTGQRAASTPVPSGGRDLLAGNRRVSGSSPQGPRAPNPLSIRGQQGHPTASVPVSFHRLSNPPLSFPPLSPMPTNPEVMTSSPIEKAPARGHGTRSASTQEQRNSQRSSRESRLRVVNVSPNPNEECDQSGRAF